MISHISQNKRLEPSQHYSKPESDYSAGHAKSTKNISDFFLLETHKNKHLIL
jgi:hypothetical protein